MRPDKRRRKSFSVKIPNSVSFSKRLISDLEDALFGDQALLGFKGHYLRQQLLSKYCDPTTVPPAERRRNAIAKWLATEERNRATNSRLFWLDATEADLGWITYPVFIRKVRKIIARILGDLKYPSCLINSAHTNGATTRVKRSSTAALHKLSGNAHCSSSCHTHWMEYLPLEGIPMYQETVEVEHSVLFTVPKKSDIDRVACKEPEINMLLQRSLGLLIRDKLRAVGINLRDQSVNQRYAQSAVRRGLATIDLSSASDSISRMLVFQLLPFDWYSLLDDLRVKSTLIDGESHELEMFSSMGNGFTFELETLIFYAITRAVLELSDKQGPVSVYGDDIIAPIGIVPRLIRIFHLVGFKTNQEKTFYRGKFRESCGKHYYGDFDVSPFFIRGRVQTLPVLINLLNQLLEWSARGVGFIEDPAILAFHKRYSRYVPQSLWGGQSCSDPSALVTGHAPRYHLVRLTSEKDDFEEIARYKHWHMLAHMTRTLDDVCIDEWCEPLSLEPTDGFGFKLAKSEVGWCGLWSPWFLEPGQPETGGNSRRGC